MLAAGELSTAAYDRASRSPLKLQSAEPALASAFIAYARDQAAKLLDSLGFDGARELAGGGLRITTTLDYDSQLQADELASRSVAVSAAVDEITLALLDVPGGEILALSGRALRQANQPGPILQPFVYMQGFLRRLVTPASMLFDMPQVYPGPADGLIYSFANPDGNHRGPLNLRDAMAAGLLPPAAQVADMRGMDKIIATAKQLGLSGLDTSRATLDLLERGGGVSTLDTGYAFSALAGMGVMRGVAADSAAAGARPRDPVAILRISDAAGNTLWQYAADDPANATALVEPSLAYMVNDILADADARSRTLAAEPASFEGETALGRRLQR